MPPLAAAAPPQTTPKPVGQAPAAGPRAGKPGRFAALLAPAAAAATVAPVANVAPAATPAGPAATPAAPAPAAPAPAACSRAVASAAPVPVPIAPDVAVGANPATTEAPGRSTKPGKAEAAPPETQGEATATSPVPPAGPATPAGQPVPVPPPVIGPAEPAGTECGDIAGSPATTAGQPTAPAARPPVPASGTPAAPVAAGPHQTATGPSKPMVAPTTTASPPAPPGLAAPQFTVPVVPPPPAHAHAVSSAHAGAQPVAAQIEQPVRLALTVELAGTAQKVSVSLHPAELGRIDVEVARDPAGIVQVTLTADRPETAARLAADQPALHAALDRAGVAPERVVTVQAAATSPDMPGFSPQTGGGQGDRSPRHAMPSGGSGFGGTPVGATQPAAPVRATMRLGLDITA